MAPSDRSMTHGGQRQPFPAVGNPPSPENSSPNSKAQIKIESSSSDADEDEDSDEDEDIAKEDEEVEDWDLGDEDSAVTPKPTANSPTNGTPMEAKAEPPQARNISVKIGSPLQNHDMAPPRVEPTALSSPPPRRSSGFQPKFRPALELTDDIETVNSDSNGSSDDSDDDDADESDDCIHDWLDGPGDPSPSISPSRRAVSPPKSVTPLTSAREASQPSPSLTRILATCTD